MAVYDMSWWGVWEKNEYCVLLFEHVQREARDDEHHTHVCVQGLNAVDTSLLLLTLLSVVRCFATTRNSGDDGSSIVVCVLWVLNLPART
jgi:hypothetical protein